MIDLSFLTDEEQEAILTVLQRDADLKRVEDERVRHLPEKVNDDIQIKNMSGQWFYEAKSKRHREKIHGADIIRASIRRKPLTAELSQRKSDKKKNSWVNNINKEVLMPPQPLEEKEGETTPSQSHSIFSTNSNILEKPQEDTGKSSISPSKQRKNPFNYSVISEENAKSERPENGMADLSESSMLVKDPRSSSTDNQPRVDLTNHHREHESGQASLEPNKQQGQAGWPPVPKARRNLQKTSDVGLKTEEPLPKAPGRTKQANGRGTPPRGILKRSSSSSSTDSEVLRWSQNLDQPNKSGLPTSTILENVVEKSSPPPPGEPEGFSQNSLERLKQVRFSSSVSGKGRLPSLEMHEGKESGEFNLLDSDDSKNSDNRTGGSEAPHDGPPRPEGPPQSRLLSPNGHAQDRGGSQEGERAPGSGGRGDSTPDVWLDTSPPVKSPSAEPWPAKEPSTKISPNVGKGQIVGTVAQVKAEQTSPAAEAASENSTGQQLPLVKVEEPRASKIGSVDPEQGKPALVEGQRAQTVSKPDKHAAEVEKAADESISKVLDWFKRTSHTAGKEAVLLSPLEEKDMLKASKDKDLGTCGSNLDSPAHGREGPTNKEYLVHEQPELSSFAKSESPSSLLIGEQPIGSQRRREDAAASADDWQTLPASVSTQQQMIDHRVNKTGELAGGANKQVGGENPSIGKEKAFEGKKPYLVLKSTDSYFSKSQNSTLGYTDGERDVKPVLQEGSFEPLSGDSFEERQQAVSEEKMPFADRGHPDLQHQAIKQSSSLETKKRVKDIRALWEREETPKLESKGEQSNKNTSIDNTILNANKEAHRVKPVGGSSGYVTAESDNEQGKYNLVSFRKVILNEGESEPDDDGLKSSSGRTTPRLMDTSKQNQPVEGLGKISPGHQKNAEFSEGPDEENLHLRRSTQDGKYLQPVALEKEKTTSVPPQKFHFKIHSLKEKLDEDAKAQMLSPSQFQSLRSFWDVGAKPQSRTDEYQVTATVPKSGISRVGNYKQESEEIKEFGVGISQSVSEKELEKELLQEQKADGPSAKVSTQHLSETSSVLSKEAGPPMHYESGNFAPKGSVALVLPKDSSWVGETRLPVNESVEKTEVPPRGQLSSFDSGLQKLLLEASQVPSPVSLPADEKGAPAVEFAAQVQRPSDSLHQQCQGVPTDRQVEASASAAAEAVNRNWAPPKADPGAFDGLEKQLQEASGAKMSPKHPAVERVSWPAAPSSEPRRFFDKVMELSHDSSGQQKGPAGPEETAGSKHTTYKYHQVGLKAGSESPSRSTDQPPPVLVKAPDLEGDHRPFVSMGSQADVFQIPSVQLVVPNAHLATQNKPDPSATEVSETVTEVHVPSKQKCSDMNAKIACLLKASSTMPRALPITENVPKMDLKDTPGESQRGSFFEGQTIPTPPQGLGSPRETTSKATERNLNANEGRDSVSSEGHNEKATVTFPFSSQKNVEVEGYAISSNEQPKDVAEMVVKTRLANSYDPAAFKASLSKFLKEDSEAAEVAKPTQTPLLIGQNVMSVYDKLTPHLPEIIETIEKSTLPADLRQREFKASFQKLLEEDSEILPARPESQMDRQTESKSNWRVDLVDQQEVGEEHSEPVNRTVRPSKQKQTEFNPGLRKLLEEATWMQSIQLVPLDSQESNREFPQEAKETVIKSTAPAKDDTVFSSNLGKLNKESSGVPLPISSEDTPKANEDSSSQLKQQSSPVKMLPSAAKASNEFRTEVKIPLKGKAFHQDSQTVEGVPGRLMVFQKTVQLNMSSAEAARPDRGESPPLCSKTDERAQEHDREREAEATPASFDDGKETAGEVHGSQRPSIPWTEKGSPLRRSQIELHLGTQRADGNEDEDARSFGSEFSDESRGSFVRIQRSRTRSEEEPSPVTEALRRSSNRQIPSKSLEDIPSVTSNEGKINLPKEDYMLSAEDVSTVPSFPDSQFSRPEKIKHMSKSVPAFAQEESDGRETDSASDSSYPLGKIKKSPSSLTNLSGSSGLASLSSVSTSVMSVYSGDFGNVDVKGNLQFAIDYVEQLKELHLFIAQAKDLAAADVKKQRSDPYVKSYLLPEKYKLGKRKTSVKKKTLNPVFNEILRYKVDKDLLATQRLNISVWHNDIFGRNSFLGEVELDLGSWDWNDKQNKQMIWYPLKPRTLLASLEAENRGEMKLALQYVPQPAGGKKTPATGEVHIWVKECNDLPILRSNKLNSFVKCTILPDTSRKSRQKTRAVAKTTNPVFNHTMVYDGFRPEDLKEACVELTVWDHNKLANHFLGGLRIGLGTGKSYGTPVDWMDSTFDEANLWERMMNAPSTWVEDTLPLRMLTTVKMAK